MNIERLIRVSNYVYPSTLLVSIPLYLVIYVASGHNFHFETKDFFWFSSIILATTTFFVHKKFPASLLFKILAGLFTAIILYGAIPFALDQLGFTYGEDVGLPIVLMFMFWPVIFILAAVLFIYSLFLRK